MTEYQINLIKKALYIAINTGELTSVEQEEIEILIESELN